MIATMSVVLFYVEWVDTVLVIALFLLRKSTQQFLLMLTIVNTRKKVDVYVFP